MAETFKNIVWNETNRAAHEAKRPAPRFEAVLLADWNRVFKRKDIKHLSMPDRFQALVGRDLGIAYTVYFVVFSKTDGQLTIITIRYANDVERQTFFR